MVVEIQCCVNSTNQHAQCPSPAPEGSGPLKKYYLTSRDFLRGKFLPRTLFRSWFLRWKHTEYWPNTLDPGESSCSGNGKSIYLSIYLYVCLSNCLSILLSICLSIHQSVCLLEEGSIISVFAAHLSFRSPLTNVHKQQRKMTST